MEDQENLQPSAEIETVSQAELQQNYQQSLLKAGTEAANLLTELIELKLMPDPRAKEMADVALEVLKLTNAVPQKESEQNDS